MERSGLNQPSDVRERIIALQNEISNLERQASQNINEDQTKVECEIDKLDGLPEDLLNMLEPVEGKEASHKYVSMKYPEVFPAMRLVKDGETRKRIVLAKESMCQDENVKLLEELVVKRAEIASILGYDSYSKYILEERMAKVPENVERFEE